MSFYSIFPYFGCMILLIILAKTPLFAAADAPPSQRPQRIATLDGLRGFLALAVFFHHATYYHDFLLNGSWILPSLTYVVLGQTGVAIFFMITGYLFWSRLLADRGRPNWIKLYIGRIFRIGPLYLAAVMVMLTFVLIRTGLHLNVPISQLANQIRPWLELGYVVGPDVNGFPYTLLILCGVTWTLHYEWIFYAALPLLALIIRLKLKPLPVLAVSLVVLFACIHRFAPVNYRIYLILYSLFLVGMISASLLRAGLALRLPNSITSTLVLALIGALFAFCDTAYAMLPVVLIGLAFYVIVSGCTVFGLLTSRPARRLGDISFGIYLLQGPVLAVMLRPAPLRAIALASPFGHWALVYVAAMLLITIATAAHVYIERPGMALGRRIVRLVEATQKLWLHPAPASPGAAD